MNVINVSDKYLFYSFSLSEAFNIREVHFKQTYVIFPKFNKIKGQ